MEKEIQQTIPPVQSLPQTPPLVPSSTNLSKIVLFVILGLAVVAGSVFVGIQIGKNQTSGQQPITVQPTTFPTQTIVNPTSEPNTISTANWKTYKNNQYSFSFKHPLTFTFKDNTGSGGDLADVPWKISLTGPNSIISSSVQKRQCNQNTGLEETPITVANKTGIRFVQEDQMDGKLFSIDKIEVQLENKLCFTLEKYVSGKEASLSQNENTSILKEMTDQDRDIFETVISTVNFSR